MRKLLGNLIWIGLLLTVGPLLVAVICALAQWLFIGLVVVIAAAVSIAALFAILR